jgi:putative addiction module component (TIGR02574 family)
MSTDPRSPGDVKLTREQLEEAERRLRTHESNPGTYSTWEEIKRRLESEHVL